MSLSDLASLGSFVSGVAVLASLVFLFFQIRQMTDQVRQAEKNQRALINQGSLMGAGENIRWLSDPTMADLRCRVTAGETQFSARELAQLRQFVRSQVILVQDAYVQLEAGLVDRMTFDTGTATLRAVFSQPVFRAIWNMTKLSYAPSWASYIEGVVRETPLAAPVDEVQLFRASLAEISSPRILVTSA